MIQDIFFYFIYFYLCGPNAYPINEAMLLGQLTVLVKPSNEKSGLVMEFFRKGFDPPPLIFESYGTGGAHWQKMAGT